MSDLASREGPGPAKIGYPATIASGRSPSRRPGAGAESLDPGSEALARLGVGELSPGILVVVFPPVARRSLRRLEGEPVVVGEGSSIRGEAPFRWTEEEGMISLGTLAGAALWQ